MGYIVKMAGTPILIKSFKLSSMEPEGRLVLVLCHWGCGIYQVCSKDDPSLVFIYLTSISNLIPNAFEKVADFFNKTVEAKVMISVTT